MSRAGNSAPEPKKKRSRAQYLSSCFAIVHNSAAELLPECFGMTEKDAGWTYSTTK
jgi:hypothetical protein